jgi:stage IV sporulation protein FB
MNQAENPIYLSFPVGTWFATRIRISVFFPLLILLIALRVHDLTLGLTIGGILFALILVHEYAHIFAARLTGGYGEEILIWPLGGLAFCHPGYSFKSKLLTPAAGPIFHAVCCLILAYPMYGTDQLLVAINPRTMREVNLFGLDFLTQVVVITFALNWILLLLNLIPVYPLDGGRILRTLLSRRLNSETATQLYIRIGVIFGFGFLLIGMFVDDSMIVCLGALVLVLNLQESFRLQTADHYDDSFMGYDFSQGYTSLERAEDDEQAGRGKGAIKRWRERRAAQRAERERQQEVDEEQQVDQILDKLHKNGRDALTSAEKQVLQRVSDRLRNKERGA